MGKIRLYRYLVCMTLLDCPRFLSLYWSLGEQDGVSNNQGIISSSHFPVAGVI
jgi:hypothetical protein